MIRQTITLMLLAIALPAAAQTGTDPGAVAAKPKPEKKICRRIEETGSIMGGKSVCHTKAEWSAIDVANNNAVSAGRDVRGQAGGQQGGGGLN